MPAASIRVTGVVQGVGFRPHAWRLARDCGVSGWVRNDAGGVLIHAWGGGDALARFEQRLRSEAPRLARVDQVIRSSFVDDADPPVDFRILTSRAGETHTGVAADSATCPDCLSEIGDEADRRFRYPFTNCTHCGPRLTIIEAVPYDRANTSMSRFPMCSECQAEFENAADRRFHAQPNACPACGPKVWLESPEGELLRADPDPITHAAALIRRGQIVAVKGIGGIHLACDASNDEVVARLRRRKHRYRKPFALMARDLAMVGDHARVGREEERLLCDPAAPVVVLQAAGVQLASGVAPGQNTLGFMLPYSPLHHLLMKQLSRPIVLTSGNRSDEPQATDNEESRGRLGGIADCFLLHDRDIVNRLDDSVVRVADGAPRLLRRARGYAPCPVALPEGVGDIARVLATGGELKNTFALVRDGVVVVSQHMGDLEDAATNRDMQKNLDLYRNLYDFEPGAVAVDMHPDYLSTRLGNRLAVEHQVPLVPVQHHHAHIASCMAEHGVAADHGKVLGIALDGLGYGGDGGLWGGEFLLADYYGYERLACLEPVSMPGGARAMREPWRNTFAYLARVLDWERTRNEHGRLDIVAFLAMKPLPQLQRMMERGINSPPASSSGRLFDAVAAAIGICRESADYEGQAAIELEATACEYFSSQSGRPYSFGFSGTTLSTAPMWHELMEDLERKLVPGIIAARFHHGFAVGLARTAGALCREHDVGTVVLGGGVFQNRLLLEQTSTLIRASGLRVLSPGKLPANDGGLSFGQAVIASASAQ